jgi:hypothetical protein
MENINIALYQEEQAFSWLTLFKQHLAWRITYCIGNLGYEIQLFLREISKARKLL